MSRSRRWFGTDGIRAPFGQAPLDEPTVRALGLALGARVASTNGTPAVAILGGDTRASTPTLGRWLADGLRHHGVTIRFVGTLPTPGIAWLTRQLEAQIGIAISASHNPYQDNGIKLIDSRGFKWDPRDEAALEDTMARLLDEDSGGHGTDGHGADGHGADGHGADGHGADGHGADGVEDGVVGAYLAALKASVPGMEPLAGLHIAIDTANGAASAFAAPLFRGLGAKVSVICDAPNGSNINRDCGSTHPEIMAELTSTVGADLGLAFDGDADRVIVADETGTARDGDALLYLWSRVLHDQGALRGNAIVATSMSNLGLEVALARQGISLVRCDVGDRAVVQTLLDHDLALGGEQSGHIVNLDLSTTGDGMLTALQIAGLCARAEAPLSTLLHGFERFPQLIENVRVASKPDFATLPTVAAARCEVDEILGDSGRLVLRYSGTEPLARIMIEGPERATIEALAHRLADAIRTAIG